MRKSFSILFAATLIATMANGAFADDESASAVESTGAAPLPGEAAPAGKKFDFFGAPVKRRPVAQPTESSDPSAEKKFPDAEKKLEHEHARKLSELEKRAAEAEKRASEAEKRAMGAEKRAADAERKLADFAKRSADAEKKSADVERKSADAEKKGADADLPVVGASPTFSGHAHWYGKELHGQRTASGIVFDKDKLTAAHPKLKFGTRVRVVSKLTGKSTVVEINDRCASMSLRCIDLSEAAAKEIGIFPHRRNDVDCFVLTTSKK